MSISFYLMLFSPWSINEYILCSPGKRKNWQSHELNDTSSLGASASQELLLFTNNENLHILRPYSKPGQELRPLNASSLMRNSHITPGTRYSHLHPKYGESKTDSRPCFLTQWDKQVIQSN